MSEAAPPIPFEAFDQLATMVALVRADGGCLLANATLENTAGLSRRALQRGNVLDWLADPAQLRETLQAVAGNHVTTSRFDAQMKRQGAGGGELPVHVIVCQTDWPGCMLVEMIEIEQQVRLDREERTHGLAQANKELVRNLAHEIKNPLGGIRGAAQLLERELDSEPLKEYTQVIIEEADRLQDLMQRLLSSHRVMQPALVNIHEILERVRRLIHAEYHEVSVRRDYDTSLPDITGDREQLIQAILNISRNAAQAMQGKGEVIFRTRAARHVTLAKKHYELALELQVIDNGPGVAEEIRDKIFYPLVSGREKGSGLGLTIAQSFVQQHGGTIEVSSRPGRTCFTLMLPLARKKREGQ